MSSGERPTILSARLASSRMPSSTPATLGRCVIIRFQRHCELKIAAGSFLRVGFSRKLALSSSSERTMNREIINDLNVFLFPVN